MRNKNIKDQKNQTESSVVKDDSYYFDLKDPRTGLRYSIPMLDTLSPTYYYDYVHYMKLKEKSPDTFEKVMRWD